MGSQAKAPAPLNRESLCVNVGQTLSSANPALIPIFSLAPVPLLMRGATIRQIALRVSKGTNILRFGSITEPRA
jgi:hypothetical protein